MKAPLPVTVCIPIKNEEANLAYCLESLAGAFPEVVVIDSGSTDQSAAIAARFGATWVDFKWDGKFPKKRNWLLRNHRFGTPWVLFLDADERLNPAFIEELRQTLPDTPHNGFWISFVNWFMGAPLRHGDPFRKLAILRLGTGEYERFPEDAWSHLDMEVHEHPVLTGTTGMLATKLEHHDYRGLDHYIAKHNQYSTWEARRFMWLANASQHDWDQLNSRQRFKYKNLDRWWLGPVYFLTSFIIKFGFLDGAAGLRFALLKMRYFIDIRLKIAELRASARPR